MKIAIITYFHDGLVGFMDFSYRIEALSNIADVDLFCRYTVQDREEFRNSRINEIVVKPKFSGLVSQLNYFYRVTKKIKKDTYDLILMLGSHGSPFIPRLSRAAPVALYWNEHPSHFFGPSRFKPMRAVRHILLKKCYSGAKKAICVMPIGEAHERDLLENGIKRERTSLIPMGVSDAFRPATRAAYEPDTKGIIGFVYIGSVQEDRGRDVMLEAFCLAHDRGLPVHLTLVGAADAQRQYCLNFLRSRGAEKTISVVGRVSGTEVIEHLRRKDFGICLWADKEYYRFNPPTKLFEYQVAGLAVLASNIATHTSFVHDAVNGIIFEYDPKSLFEALLRITNNRQQIEAWKNNSLNHSEQYLWSNIKNDFIAQIKTAIAET